MPGGAAAGAAVQFRMLATSGQAGGGVVGGLAAFSLLGVGGLLALPVFVLPVILIGSPINRGLYNAAIIGSIGFVAFAGFAAAVLVTDAPLRWSGLLAQRIRNAVLRRRPPLTGLDHTLLKERDLIRSVLGKQWWQAVLLSAGRLAFDFLCLLAAVRATGSHPAPSLVLVAYAVSGIIGLIPITPGGLGIVEASPTVSSCWPGRLGRRLPGHPHLPAGLLLGAHAGRPDRLWRLPPPLPEGPVLTPSGTATTVRPSPVTGGVSEFGVHSEVGKLRKVLVHRPDLSLQRLTPIESRRAALRRCAVVAGTARARSVAVEELVVRGVEVFYVHDLLSEALAAPGGMEWAIEHTVSARTVGPAAVDTVRAALATI